MEQNRMKIITTIGSIITLIVVGIFIISYGKQFETRNWITVIMNTLLILISFFSWIHINNRAQAYSSTTPFRKYLQSMMLFFIPIIIFGIYLIIEEYYYVIGKEGITDSLDSLHPTIVFYLFGRDEWRTSIPISSIFIFGILMLAILAFMYPIEKYIKQEKIPIHTYLQLLIILALPLLLVDALVKMTLFFSIIFFTLIIIVFANFFYLFWVYFAVAMKSPKGPMRRGGIMIGVSLFIIILSWVSTWALASFALELKLSVTYGIAIVSIVLLNLGFYTLRPIST